MRLLVALGLVVAALLLPAAPAVHAQRESVATSATVALHELPSEARGLVTLIRKGGPFPYPKDGVVFGNREGRLPHASRGYYHEYTVPTPGAHNRGARRIVAGQGGELYYSDDHYGSFRRIRE